MKEHPKGELIIIGGHEEKEGDRKILSEVAERVKRKKGTLVIITVASNLPKEQAEEYTKVFNELGVKEVDILDIRTREEAHNQENVEKIKKSAVVFFTGGDQLRISSQLGDSPVYQCMQECYQIGGVIVGTSAGAACMPETMIISGPSDESNKVSALDMAPGLGLMPNVVIDSHFAERGRMGRLLGAVAQNPKNLGIGIDEDTAIIVDDEKAFTVVGSGAVYVVDGTSISYSSLSEKNPDGIISIYDVKLHVMGEGDCFDLKTRQPKVSEKVEKETT